MAQPAWVQRRLPPRARLAVAANAIEPRVVWIFASPRSGTTWLATLVGVLTSATLIDEPLIGAHLAVPVSVVTSVPTPADPLLYETHASNPSYFFSEDAASAWQPGLRALLRRRFAAAMIASGSPAGPVIVKEPNGSLAAPILMRALPRSRLLFLVRDGRDVVDSLIDGASGGWITTTHGSNLDVARRHQFIETRAHHWVHTTDAVQKAYDAHDPRLRLRLSYEDLRVDAAHEVERILRWLGREDALPAIPEMVDRLRFENLPAQHRGQGQFARAAQPGLWQAHFSPEEQALLREIMGGTLTRLGYES